MNLIEPSAIAASAIKGAPVAYVWDRGVSRAILYPTEDEYPRLAHAFEQISSQAALAMCSGLAEWIAWRFDGMVDVGDLLARAEAGYAVVALTCTSTMAQPTEPFPKTLTEIHGPIMLARMIAAYAVQDFVKDPDTAAGWAFRMARLALHVQPPGSPLKRWLETTLRRANATAPEESQQILSRAFLFDASARGGAAAIDAEARTQAEDILRGGNPYLAVS